MTLGEAISALLYLGLEFTERQRTGLKEDIEDVHGGLTPSTRRAADAVTEDPRPGGVP